jgi:hypothetical protein
MLHIATVLIIYLAKQFLDHPANEHLMIAFLRQDSHDRAYHPPTLRPTEIPKTSPVGPPYWQADPVVMTLIRHTSP